MSQTAIMSLYEKLVELRKHVGCLVKDQEGYGYNYVTGNQILYKVKDKMNELGLVLIPSAGVGETYYKHDYTTANGVDKVDFIVMGEMSYTLVNADDGNEKLVIPWAYYGQQDDISKAYGSALTYSERYFWLKLLGLPTDEDDPDAKNTSDNKVKTYHQPHPSQVSPVQGPAQEVPSSQVNNQHDDIKKLFQNNNKARYISDAQQKRLFAIAGGDKNIIAALLSAHGLSNESEITMGKQYETICKQAENMANNQQQSV